MKINFLGLPDHPEAKVALIPIPFELTTTWLKGTKEAPAEILKVSQNLEFFDEETALVPHQTLGFFTYPLEEYPLDLKEALNKIEAKAEEVLNKEVFPIFIGGEHTITLGIVKAFKKRFPQLKILHLDAHLDFRKSYLNSSFNHATVMRHIYEEGLRFFSIGIRAISEEEFLEIKQKGLSVIFAHELKKSFESTLNEIDAFLKEGEIYLTLDLDVLDPSLAPGVGTPEPGGLNWYELMEILKRVSKAKVVGMDLVETRPLPGNPFTEFLAAKIILKFTSYLAKVKYAHNA
ncbi:MAG: agmatinase [Caldimicrobium sp.]